MRWFPELKWKAGTVPNLKIEGRKVLDSTGGDPEPGSREKKSDWKGTKGELVSGACAEGSSGSWQVSRRSQNGR